jgi:hypothetical protein
MSFFHSDSEHPREPSRLRWLAAAGAGVVVLAVALSAYFFLSRAPSEPRRELAPVAKAPPAPKPSEPSPRTDLEPRAGSLEVSADVEGATVYLDGERVGEAPYREEGLRPGRYEVRVERQGYRPFRSEVRISAGKRARVQASLSLEAAVLRVESDVPGASVFVDRRYLGTTPLETRDVGPGEHQITVSAEGHDMYADTFAMTSESRDIMVRFKEVRLDEAVPVVHKHRIGSCSGRLVATLAGLRYESSDRKDGFSVPFSGISEFRVDYLQKNLRVKLKSGRTYNFTEPSGNADALYVFHQKVEAATKKESP